VSFISLHQIASATCLLLPRLHLLCGCILCSSETSEQNMWKSTETFTWLLVGRNAMCVVPCQVVARFLGFFPALLPSTLRMPLSLTLAESGCGAQGTQMDQSSQGLFSGIQFGGGSLGFSSGMLGLDSTSMGQGGGMQHSLGFGLQTSQSGFASQQGFASPQGLSQVAQQVCISYLAGLRV
jgi:hypothetical protein